MNCNNLIGASVVILLCAFNFFIQSHIESWPMRYKCIYNVSVTLIFGVVCYLFASYKPTSTCQEDSSDSISTYVEDYPRQINEEFQHHPPQNHDQFNQYSNVNPPNFDERPHWNNKLSFNSTRGRKHYKSPDHFKLMREKAFRNTPPLPPSPLQSSKFTYNHSNAMSRNDDIRSFSLSPKQFRKPELKKSKMHSAPIYSTQPEFRIHNKGLNVSRFSDLSTISPRSTQDQTSQPFDLFNLSGEIPINASQDRSTVYASSQSQNSRKHQSQPSQEKYYRRSIHETDDTMFIPSQRSQVNRGITQPSQDNHMVLTQESQKRSQDPNRMSIDSRPHSQQKKHWPTANFPRNQKRNRRCSMMSVDSLPPTGSQMSLD